MYISDSRSVLLKHIIGNTIGAVFLAVFGMIYEAFSHEVYSYAMIYAFLVPVVMGIGLYSYLAFRKMYPGRAFLNLWNASIASFSVGMLFAGVMEIYGTESMFTKYYFIIGGILAASAGMSLLVKKKQS